MKSKLLYTLLFLAVSAGMAAIWFSRYSTGPSIYLTPPDTAVPPRVVPIASGPAEVPRGGHRDFPFSLPSHLCRVTGRIAGLSALLFSDTAYARFLAGQQAKPVWDSGRTPDSKLDVVIIGPGTFHLFVDNESDTSHPSAPVMLQAQAICP